jgi:MFS family permease
MATDEKGARALVDYLLKHRYLIISRVAASSGAKPVAQLEKAEKRFILAFITNTLASILIILSRVWGITSLGQLVSLRFGDIFVLGLGAVSLATLLQAWMAYLQVGVTLSIDRAVEIKQKD